MSDKEGGCILIVDDEQQIRRFLRISLVSQGYEVIEASSGEQALATAFTRSVDLVLLDLGLPDMDGQEVLLAIREQSDVPVIVVSVREREEDKVVALDHGANDYVTKPPGVSSPRANCSRKYGAPLTWMTLTTCASWSVGCARSSAMTRKRRFCSKPRRAWVIAYR